LLAFVRPRLRRGERIDRAPEERGRGMDAGFAALAEQRHHAQVEVGRRHAAA
jgi:hypothetical protein